MGLSAARRAEVDAVRRAADAVRRREHRTAAAKRVQYGNDRGRIHRGALVVATIVQGGGGGGGRPAIDVARAVVDRDTACALAHGLGVRRHTALEHVDRREPGGAARGQRVAPREAEHVHEPGAARAAAREVGRAIEHDLLPDAARARVARAELAEERLVTPRRAAVAPQWRRGDIARRRVSTRRQYTTRNDAFSPLCSRADASFVPRRPFQRGDPCGHRTWRL